MNDREIAGVKVFVSNETYDEYKGTLQAQIKNLLSKIDKAIELIKENKDQVDWLHMPAWELENVLKEDK